MTRARAGAPKLVDRETALLADQLRKAWRVREASSPIHAVLKFEAEGLVLGAGTILAEPGADLTPGGAGETRLTTLLAAAYGRRMTKDVVGHIRSANARWREADQRLADLHQIGALAAAPRSGPAPVHGRRPYAGGRGTGLDPEGAGHR